MSCKVPILAMTLVFPVLVSCSQAARDATSKEDAQECAQFAQGVQTCAVNFANLSANPDRYEGKRISIVGFLAIDTGRLFLYPSKDAYDYSDNANSIYIETSFERATELAESRTSRYVQVVGGFSKRDLGARYGTRVGVIELLGTPIEREVRPNDGSSTIIDFDVDLSKGE